MYIDKQVKAFLEQMTTGGAEAPLTIEEERATFSSLWRSLSPASVSVGREDKIKLPVRDDEIECNVYWPELTEEPLPVLVFYHGGGCVTLRPDDFAATSTRLAKYANCIVVVPAFRQAPEHPFPKPLEDAYDSLCWLQANVQSLGGDPKRIAICGDSGGGYLAAAVTQEAKRCGTPQPIYQVLIYPMLDMAAATPSRVTKDYFVNDAALRGVIERHVGDKVLDPRASPLRSDDLNGLPPATVLVTDLDPLVDEARAYTDKLRAAGVPTSYFVYEGVVHGFFSFGGIIDEGNRAVRHVAGVLADTFEHS